MELPNLGSPEGQKVRDMLGLGPEWQWDNGVVYDPGFARFKLNQKGLLASGEIDPLNMQYQAMLAPNGNSRLQVNGMIDPLKLQYQGVLNEGGYGISASMPLLKGLISLEAQRHNDEDSAKIMFKKEF